MQKEKGLDTSKRHHPISRNHLIQIYENYFDDHFDNDPRCLQHKVYFDIASFMGKRGSEGLRQLREESFNILTNSEGKEYLTLTTKQPKNLMELIITT